MNRKLINPKNSNRAFVAAGVTTVGLFAANYLPDTFCLGYYRDFVQCYKNAEPVPISETVLKRFEMAKDICQLEPYEQNLVKPFSVFGFDVTFAGTTKSKFGAIVGIPSNYEYESALSIQRNEIRFRDQEIDWNAESGKFLEESLVLTEDEQIFGFCRAFLQLKTQYVLMNSLFPSVSFLMVYTIGHYLNASMGLLARPFSLRLVMYSILGLFGLGSWCFVKDFNQVSCDADIDKQLAAMGPTFVQAGVNFYDKQLKKNIALRNLLGDTTYTAKGNLNYTIRQESLPLTMRKAYFQNLQKETFN